MVPALVGALWLASSVFAEAEVSSSVDSSVASADNDVVAVLADAAPVAVLTAPEGEHAQPNKAAGVNELAEAPASTERVEVAPKLTDTPTTTVAPPTTVPSTATSSKVPTTTGLPVTTVAEATTVPAAVTTEVAAVAETSTTSEAASLGEQALSRVSYPWRTKFPEWDVVFRGPRNGIRALTYPQEKKIEIFIRSSDTAASLHRVFAHELGHVVDVEMNSSADRDRWVAQRGIDSSAPWWPNAESPDFATGAGDFAEAFAVWETGVTTRSSVGSQPTAADLTLLRELSGV